MKEIKDKWWLNELINRKEFVIEDYFTSASERTLFIKIKSKDDNRIKGVIALERKHRHMMKKIKDYFNFAVQTYKEMVANKIKKEIWQKVKRRYR